MLSVANADISKIEVMASLIGKCNWKAGRAAGRTAVSSALVVMFNFIS